MNKIEYTRNLLAHGLNKLIDDGLITRNNNVAGHFQHIKCDLLGKPSVILYKSGGCKELVISVWWNYDETKHPQHINGGYSERRIYGDNYPPLTDFEIEERGGKYGSKKMAKYLYEDSDAIERYQCSSPLAIQAKFRNFVGAVASCWVERDNGFYLQGKGLPTNDLLYIRKDAHQELKNAPICKPLGFETTGNFHM